MKFSPIAFGMLASLAFFCLAGCDSTPPPAEKSAISPVSAPKDSTMLPPGVPPQAREQIEKKMKDKAGAPQGKP